MSDNVIVARFGRPTKFDNASKNLESEVMVEGAEILDKLTSEETHAEGKARCMALLAKLGGESKEGRRELKDKKQQAHFSAKNRL